MLPPREHGPAFLRRRAILLLLLSAALLGALLLHDSAPAVEAQTLEKPEAAQLVRLHLGAYLFWHESSGADGYEIQIRSQSGGTWGSWSSISYTGTTQPATVTGLSAGTRYQWRIRATSGSEQSEWSTHDDVNDLAYNWTVESLGRSIANPAVLQSAEPGDPGEVTVTWTHGPARSGVTITGWTVGYRLFSEPVDQIRQTSLLAASATMGTVTGLTGGEQYEFWVRPYVGGYPGRTSNALEATPTTTSVPIATPVPTQSSDATLRALSVSAGSISPAFSSTTYAYTVSVASGVASTTVTPTVNHSDATVTVNGTTVASGTASGSIPLVVGDNTITVRVTAENGVTQDYTVTITRQSRDADLSALVASAATSESATYLPQTLTPTFAAGTTSYAATVGNAMTHAKVTPTVNHSAATVTVNGTMVTSGTASAAIALSVGANAITVRVTAEDTSFTRNYTVTITRQARDAVEGSLPAPSGLTVTPCPHCLSVTWTAPVGTVDGYDVHYTTVVAEELADDADVGYYDHPRAGRIVNRHPGRGWVTLPKGDREPKYGIGYLQPGQEYRVRVRAYNSQGTGPWAVGKGTPLQARRTVTLSASAVRVREGDAVTITATVMYGGRPTVIQEDMDVLLSLHLGTAESGDVGTLERISIGKYTSRASATIQTHRDSDGDDETFAVLIRSIPKRSLARAGHPAIVWVTITEGDPAPPEPVALVPELRASGADGGLYLTWGETSTEHDGYDVQYKLSATENTPETPTGDPETGWVDAGHTGLERSLTIWGLTNWVAHDARVRLTFPDGTGRWSEVATATPEEHDVELGEPSAVTVTISDTAAEEGETVTLTATLDEPAPREGATVQFWAYGNTIGGTVTAATVWSDYRLSPPDPGVEVQVTVPECRPIEGGAVDCRQVRKTVRSINNFTTKAIRIEPGRTTATATLAVQLNQQVEKFGRSVGYYYVDEPIAESAEGIGVYATANVPDADHKHGRRSLTSPTVTMTIYDVGQSPTVTGNQGSPPEQETAAQPTAVTLALGQTSVGESGGTVTVTATLDAPAPDGGIGGFLLAGADGTASEGIDFTMPLSIFIPGGEHSASASITITGDDVDESDETVVISALFDMGTAVLEDTITLTIADDDTAGVTVRAASPLAVDEGATAIYTVVLDSEPTSDVTITATSGDTDAVSVSPASHTFTPSTWSTPATFTVTGVTDADTRDESVGVSHGVTSADATYANALAGTVRVSVSDTTTPPPQQQNRAPTVASAIADATIVNQGGTQSVSLSGVFSDADNDSLTITAASSNEAVATVSVAAGGSSLTVSARSRGTATITVTADDGNGGTVSVAFAVRVKAAPTVASAVGDVSGLTEGDTRDVSLSGVFSDADGDSLTITAASSDSGKATVSAAPDGSRLTLTGVAEGTATVTVTAQDADGNRVSDRFTVAVEAAPPQETAPADGAPTVASPLADVSLVGPTPREISLSGVFNDPDGDSLIITAVSSHHHIATMWVDGTTLTVVGISTGTATITVTARDADGNEVSDGFEVTVSPVS